uniref:ENTH domain-containing protein n=1 Tax=Solanum tuberosum TaxID=4113 RepID=M1DL88_SOLTU
MDYPLLHEFKRQASFFLKEKIKTARLVVTDVTHTQLLAEEATTGDLIAPNMQTMRLISRAAFEIDDYWRIVDILHNRFNWGSSVRNMSERVIKLLEDRSFLKKERGRARKVTVGIKGFGSFCKCPVSSEESMKEAISERYLRSNSGFTDCHNKENQIMASDKGFSCKQKLGKSWNIESVIDDTTGDAMEWNQHPFYGNHSRASLFYISGLSGKAISLSLEKKKEG